VVSELHFTAICSACQIIAINCTSSDVRSISSLDTDGSSGFVNHSGTYTVSYS
jgi:hypothetical protein